MKRVPEISHFTVRSSTPAQTTSGTSQLPSQISNFKLLGLCLGLAFACSNPNSSAFARDINTNTPATRQQVSLWLSNYVQEPRFNAATWAIKIVSLKSGETWFEHNPQVLQSPASNSKLYTVALGLTALGEDHRIRTSLYAGADVQDGVLKGDLILYGRGDPTITARRHGGNVLNGLAPLVQGVTNAGIREISGDLIADESFIRGPRYGSGWSWDDLNYYYGAEISALTIIDNTVELVVSPATAEGDPGLVRIIPEIPAGILQIDNRTRTVAKGKSARVEFHRPLGENRVVLLGEIPLDGTPAREDIPIANPAQLFGSFLREALQQAGVKVRGQIRTVDWLERHRQPLELGALREIASLESLPMRELAREIQKPSQNLYTDLLLAYVGEQKRTPQDRATITSEDLGLAQLRTFLSRAGVSAGQVFFEEGSGLSRNNLTTANATIDLLQYMSRGTYSNAFWNALPVAGVDGTLRNRFKNTPAQGKVLAKTGTLRWASSLSGQLSTSGGEPLLFSLMLNRYSPVEGGGTARTALDEVVLKLINAE